MGLQVYLVVAPLFRVFFRPHSPKNSKWEGVEHEKGEEDDTVKKIQDFFHNVSSARKHSSYLQSQLQYRDWNLILGFYIDRFGSKDQEKPAKEKKVPFKNWSIFYKSRIIPQYVLTSTQF